MARKKRKRKPAQTETQVQTSKLLQDLSEEAPDRSIIAQSLVDSAGRIGRGAPATADLTEAISDVLPESHIKGASVMKVTLMDEDFVLLDSGFFSPADDKVKGKKRNVPGRPGTLDPLEINYPPNSKYWWRLSTLSAQDDGQLDLLFADRVQDDLLALKPKMKSNRAAVTRAEFLRAVAHKVPEIRFHSEQLHVKQPIDPADLQAGSSPAERVSTDTTKHTGNKTVGLGANHGQTTVKGQRTTPGQAAVINVMLQQAHKEGAGEAATVAMIYAGTYEQEFSPSWSQNSAGAQGPLQGTDPFWSAHHDIALQVHYFMRGGYGFHYGAMNLEKQGVSNPVEIAIRVEVPSVWPRNSYATQTGYPGDAAAVREAQGIVQNGGGAASTGGLSVGTTGPGRTIEVAQPYFFDIGLGGNNGETGWDGMQREAQEVNWELFTDGPDMYYDSEMTLIKDKPVAVLHRDDLSVVGWNYDWENRNIATSFTMSLLCDPFEFRAGQVVMLLGFGIDEASTAHLPGRWLIQDIVRQAGSFVSQVTFKQPERPKNEPAPQVTSKTIGGSGGGALASGGVIMAAGGKTGPAPGSSPGRLDMGQDGNYSNKGAVAVFDGVAHVDRRGWPGEGDYIWIKNDNQSGPDYTRAMYYAEGAKAIVRDGQHVVAGQKIGIPVAHGGTGAPGNFEIGPANTTNGEALAKNYGLGSAGARKMVLAFSGWIVSLGMPRPSDTSHAGNA